MVTRITVASLCGLAMPTLAAELQVLRGQMPRVVSGLQPLERLAGSKPLDLAIALPLRHRAELKDLLERIYDPASPDYRRYLTPEQFAERFGPTEKDYEAVVAFAQRHGFTVSGTHPNRVLLDVRGTVGQVEKALRVQMKVYRRPSAQGTFFAADAEPSLDLAVPVLSIGGLDDFNPPRPMGLTAMRFQSTAPPVSYAAGSGPRGSFIGEDFRRAYAPGVTLDGAGQSVGLIAFDGYYPSDIADYRSLAGLPEVVVRDVYVNGEVLRPGPNNLEVVLDVNMAVSMAPGLASVIIYLGRTPNSILNKMATDNAARQLSSSWGFGLQVDPAREQIFMQFAAQGQSFFQASGDWGAWQEPVYPPSDDPWLTVVGGTALTTSQPGGAWQSETTWSGSGGGFSTTYPIPLWQRGVSMTANQGSMAMRNIPDVACMAEEDIWLIGNRGEHGAVGGTSAAAPLWAGFTALVNQQAAARGLPPVGFLNPALYAIGQGPRSSSAFHDITTGSNTNSSSPIRFFAVPGYDLCTGWGTPTGSNLIEALLAPADALQIEPETGLKFSGAPGGPFHPMSSTFTLTDARAASLRWVVGSFPAWLDVAPVDGTLRPGQEEATVTVRLTEAGNTLEAGSHEAILWFTNMNNGFAQRRLVLVEVQVQPVITEPPASQAVREGMSAVFSVQTAPNAGLSYQWRHDNGVYLTNLIDGGEIAGATTRTLTVRHAALAHAGAYSVVVRNPLGQTTSSSAVLTINPWGPEILTQPESRTVLIGQRLTLMVSAAGSRPLEFQWLKNGSALADGSRLTGSRTSELTFVQIDESDAGSYAVTVNNALGWARSDEAILSVDPSTAPGVVMTTLYSFTGGTDGAQPSGLIGDGSGALVGTTIHGGTHGEGSLFRISTLGELTSLYSFNGGTDGANPFAALALGPNGHLYGSTFQGGLTDNGTLFRLTPEGELETLVAFTVANGDFPYAPLTLAADGNLYGTSYQGGERSRGTAFRMSPNGALTTLVAFSNGNEGGHPSGHLAEGNGYLYGTTFKGGTLRVGTVFRLTASGDFTNLVSFNHSNGAFPYAGLTVGADGRLYGVTTVGGLYDGGTVFRVTPEGLLTSLYSFTEDIDGASPQGALVAGTDGNFYGTTARGGVYGHGTVFAIAPEGALLSLAHFNGFNGAYPHGALLEDSEGGFYGTTRFGGAYGHGTIFHLRFDSGPLITSQPAGAEVFAGDTVLLSVSALGSTPLTYQWHKHGLVLTEGGHISGTRTRILALVNVTAADAGTYSVVVSNSFGPVSSAGARLVVTSSPPTFVQQPTNQTLAPGAAASFTAVVFGNLPIVYRWHRNGTALTDGERIEGAATRTLVVRTVTEADNGTYTLLASNALGMAASTGAALSVIAVSASGTRLSTLRSFAPGNDEGWNLSGLALGNDGKLYGATQFGHISTGGHGNLFSITTNGEFRVLAVFGGFNGSQPSAAPVHGADGYFYGTTSSGGEHEAGTIFKMASDGRLTVLYSFPNAGQGFGGYPTAALVQSRDGFFYGTTTETWESTLFKISPAGLFTNLHYFNSQTDGHSPNGALLAASDGHIYGVTGAGGAFSDGTIFKLTPEGVLTTVHAFAYGTNGMTPAGPLVQGTDGHIYGVTTRSTQFGFEAHGTVFRMAPDGLLTTLHRFRYTDGSHPMAGLIEGSDGNFYGTTRGQLFGNPEPRPSPGNGTLFRITPTGALTTLVMFDGINVGAHPESPLVEGPDGNLYGTTTSGGIGHGGTIFRLGFTAAPIITRQPSSQNAPQGATVRFSVAVFGAAPLTYRWQKDGTELSDAQDVSGTTARILQLRDITTANAGAYAVTIGNALGTVKSASVLLLVQTPPEFVSVVLSNDALTFSWRASVGQRYQLESSPELNPSDWVPLGDAIVATDEVVSASDSLGSSPRRFYRVILLP